jgi:hypothetical protein
MMFIIVLPSHGRRRDGGDRDGRAAPTLTWILGAAAVPLYRLLQDGGFDPEVVAAMSAAFEETCRTLGLAERTDPLRDLVARTILECARMGERNPERLRECALQAIRG